MRVHLHRPTDDLLPAALCQGYERLAITSALDDVRLEHRARLRSALARHLRHRRS